MSDNIEAKLKAAEAAIVNMSKNFAEWIRADIDKAKNALQSSQADISNCKEPITELFYAMHDIKGLGGSFGFDLVTSIADSCCYLLKKTETRNLLVIKVCEAHLKALDTVIAQNVKGDGGKCGAAIMAKLSATVDDALAALNK